MRCMTASILKFRRVELRRIFAPCARLGNSRCQIPDSRFQRGMILMTDSKFQSEVILMTDSKFQSEVILMTDSKFQRGKNLEFGIWNLPFLLDRGRRSDRK